MVEGLLAGFPLARNRAARIARQVGIRGQAQGAGQVGPGKWDSHVPHSLLASGNFEVRFALGPMSRRPESPNWRLTGDSRGPHHVATHVVLITWEFVHHCSGPRAHLSTIVASIMFIIMFITRGVPLRGVPPPRAALISTAVFIRYLLF